ncbi:hypothetical protein SS50377_20943 [Spironucleus salmonicida]|uniref:Uncharacterized protein n=1 Tax=Spironucleus salmonicida TaxID=348837 RepID=V6LIR5_9EUKA|nr:hypothetical protein SS50377_20943 [Spironucleus salmonicida]|eukprot:EST43616.1 Hypothetical protein SS50377_16658 [Spironucleus salmonicida]
MGNLPQIFLDEDDVSEALSKLSPSHQRVAGALSLTHSNIPIALWSHQYIDSFLKTVAASSPQISYKAFRGAISSGSFVPQLISDFAYLSTTNAYEFSHQDLKSRIISSLFSNKFSTISALFSGNFQNHVSQQLQQTIFSQVVGKGFGYGVEAGKLIGNLFQLIVNEAQSQRQEDLRKII